MPDLCSAIPDAVPAAVRQAVESLTLAKERVDRLYNGGKVDRLIASQAGLPADATGADFFQLVFPFYGRWQPIAPTQIQNVPVSQVLGHSWRWQPNHIPAACREELCARFLNPNADSSQFSIVMWIVPLGLYIAHEGKNRVAFLRNAGITHYPAKTTPYDYPAPNRIKLYRLAGTHGEEWWAVLDGDQIEALRHPEWATMVLTAYGVETSDRWPGTFPSLASVRDTEQVRQQQHLNLPFAPVVSLLDLKAKEAFEASQVSASLLDITEVYLHRRWKIGYAIVAPSALAAVAFVQPTWSASSLATAAVGAMLALAVFLGSEVFSVPRRLLRSRP